jgi:hypothetical protein
VVVVPEIPTPRFLLRVVPVVVEGVTEVIPVHLVPQVKVIVVVRLLRLRIKAQLVVVVLVALVPLVPAVEAPPPNTVVQVVRDPIPA